jgi:hypothetical protein
MTDRRRGDYQKLENRTLTHFTNIVRRHRPTRVCLRRAWPPRACSLPVRTDRRRPILGHFEDHPANAAVVPTIEPDDGVIALTALCDKLWIVNLQHRLLESHEFVWPSIEQPAERGYLNRRLLEGAVRKKKWHRRRQVDAVARPGWPITRSGTQTPPKLIKSPGSENPLGALSSVG